MLETSEDEGLYCPIQVKQIKLPCADLDYVSFPVGQVKKIDFFGMVKVRW